ncbi:MAG: B12-binding domain-containing radical SAM protein [Kiritimatiellae bacterium]|nr:B12-binding domain-containing radical SAM protein [Kiritimatiellia bacterium]
MRTSEQRMDGTGSTALPQVTLIQPPVTDASYPALPFSIEPLSLLVLAALTPKDAFRVKVLDGMLRGERRRLLDPASALVGITVVTPVRDAAYELAAWYRAKGVPVVLGGCHVTLDPEDARPHADAIVVGEAEEAWPRLLADFAAGRLKQEYRPAGPESFDVPAARALVSRYRMKYPFISIIQTTRGCPNTCEFCVPAATYGQRIRHRSVESVLDEIEQTRRRFRRKTFGFTEDNFFADRRYAVRLMEALVPLRIRWASQMCIDIAKDDAVLDLMVESGCFAAFFGFESPNQQALDEARKRADSREYPALIARVRARGILVIGSFTIGYDCDDDGVYDEMVSFCRQTAIEVPLFVSLMPYKGTALFDRLVRAGRLAPDARPGSNPLALNFEPSRLAARTFARNIARMYREYYDSGYLLRNLRHWFRRSHYKKCLLLIVLYLLYVTFARRIGRGAFLEKRAGRGAGGRG